ncbi:hypothetical protein AJ79_02232 [Helicocarpus griseus UAMH5409]|uniref:Uncharacterized protein n=1 Tax=Helicocarpus griseus UAMH5409 TaxID=1447875 RepID=A0A2B7Y3C0_9EURO|nr:hypothetical protein AJ79_02232 [Helicocarpus griseus UAMH5409]
MFSRRDQPSGTKSYVHDYQRIRDLFGKLEFQIPSPSFSPVSVRLESYATRGRTSRRSNCYDSGDGIKFDTEIRLCFGQQHHRCQPE